MSQKGRSLKEVQQRGHLYETQTIIDTVWTASPSHPCYTLAKQSRLSPSRPRGSRERRVDLDLWADNECHPSTAWAPRRPSQSSAVPFTLCHDTEQARGHLRSASDQSEKDFYGRKEILQLLLWPVFGF